MHRRHLAGNGTVPKIAYTELTLTILKLPKFTTLGKTLFLRVDCGGMRLEGSVCRLQ